MRVLVIKTSSLGDIIHTLPALTDAAKRYPSIQFDWLVERAFQEVPGWHRGVSRVIPIALRALKESLFTKHGLINSVSELRATRYDKVIDAQGLLKSAVLSWLSWGEERIGLSWKSAREPLASLINHKKISVPWGPHAVQRVRDLFAGALEYSLQGTVVDYGIERSRLGKVTAAKPYIVFLHGTTWESKHWPEIHWIGLAKCAVADGYTVRLLWGSVPEHQRALRIAAAVPGVEVLPERASLTEIAGILAAAAGVITVDTGLGHLTAALGVPAVALYGPTDPVMSGILGEKQISLKADYQCAPCLSRMCHIKDRPLAEPPCLAKFSPSEVWAVWCREREAG